MASGFTNREPAGSDELGQVIEAFGHLGLSLDALMRHIVQTDRLATLALISKTIAVQVEAEVGRLGAAATRLQQHSDDTVQEAAHAVAAAAARILATVRCLDRPFQANAGRR